MAVKASEQIQLKLAEKHDHLTGWLQTTPDPKKDNALGRWAFKRYRSI